MAGDWIKMRSNLWDDPRVARLCDDTDQSEAAVVGALYWLWAAADQHTEDGILHGMTLKAIDRKTGIAGFGSALVGIGWVADHPEGVRIVNFHEHNGASAKRRSMDAQRKSAVRHESASDADNGRTQGGQNAPNCGARERVRVREEKETKDIGAGAPAPKRFTPPTHDELVAEFAGKVHNQQAEAIKFLGYYKSNGWKVGKNPMKDWKSAVAGWATRSNENAGHQRPVGQTRSERGDQALRAYFDEIDAEENTGNGLGGFIQQETGH